MDAHRDSKPQFCHMWLHAKKLVTSPWSFTRWLRNGKLISRPCTKCVCITCFLKKLFKIESLISLSSIWHEAGLLEIAFGSEWRLWYKSNVVAKAFWGTVRRASPQRNCQLLFSTSTVYKVHDKSYFENLNQVVTFPKCTAKQEMSFTQAIIEMFLITSLTNYITVYLLSSGFKITTLGSKLIPYF